MKNPVLLLKAMIEQAEFDSSMSRRRPGKCREEINNLKRLEKLCQQQLKARGQG